MFLTGSGAIAALHPTGARLVGIETDQDGMNPAHLESVLSTWNFSEKRLRVIYTIPIGQNPSGATLTLERKKKIYEIASKYNLLIVEDDPYYFLQLPTPSRPVVESIPSFLSMDVDGRVVRFDSFSKIMSSGNFNFKYFDTKGIRLGWVTGPKFLVERLQLDQQASVLHPSGLSQVVLYSILNKWGKEGLEAQKKAVQAEYMKRRDFTIQCAEKYLTGLAEWFSPSAGMFIWFKLKGIQDTSELIMKKAVEEKFLMVPGQAFSPDSSKPSPYVRAAFSTATFEQIEEAIKRLSNLLKNYKKE